MIDLKESHLTLFSFEAASDPGNWRSIDDVVMGGRSSSRAAQTDNDGLIFSGVVSLEDNGGFASIRSENYRYDLSEYDAVRLRIKGDGKRYGFNIRTGNPLRALRYETTFATTSGEWQEITLPFESFRVKMFGSYLPTQTHVNPRRIRSFGFIISEKQAGPFQLEIDRIEAVRIRE